MPRGRKPGTPKTPGSGRRPGQQNYLTLDVKNMILGALSDLGGRAYLAAQGAENPAAFMVLVGKILPLQVAGDPTGSPIVVEIVHFAKDDKDPPSE